MASLDLVPEEQITLRELKLLQIVFLDEGNANGVERSEQPTATAALLVGHRFAFGFHLIRDRNEEIDHFHRDYLI